MRGVLIYGLLVFLFFINLASASYLCSDNTTLTTDTREIDLGDEKTINGLIIGLVEVEERPATNRIMARILVDSKLMIVVNNSSAQTGLFTDGTSYSISVVNITGEGINVKVGSTTKLMEIGETGSVDGKFISIINYVGTYPGWFNVSFMVGKNESYLASWEVMGEIFKINSKNYLVSLMSASNNDAIIKVSKCQNASMEIKELASNNSAPLNQSSNETADINNTSIDNSTIANNTGNVDGNGNESINSNQKTESFLKIGTYIGGALTILVILFIIFKYMQKKKEINAEVKGTNISG